MEITEVKVRLADNQAERLRGFCTITLDGEFVVRDIKIIDVIQSGHTNFSIMPCNEGNSDYCNDDNYE